MYCKRKQCIIIHSTVRNYEIYLLHVHTYLLETYINIKNYYGIHKNVSYVYIYMYTYM